MSALVSIIIPARDEEAGIEPLERALTENLTGLPYDFEFIVIDNGSTDGTEAAVRAICSRDVRWKYVRFSRNFGIEASIAAGYRLAIGEAIIVLYSDLQDPPSLILAFLEKWQQGYDVVYGIRTVRHGDPAWRNFMAGIFYRVIDKLADISIPRNVGDFRLISRPVRDALDTCAESNRYMRGLISWLGFRQTGIEYERHARTTGQSKEPLGNVLGFALNAVTSFSIKPLRLFSLLGFALLGLSFLVVLVYVLALLAGSHPPAGTTTIIMLILLGIGINSLGIGVLGEYLGRTYAETKRRPLYIVADSVNLERAGLPVRSPAANSEAASPVNPKIPPKA